jgi:hypothetical protein
MARKTVSGTTQEDGQVEVYYQWFLAGAKKASEEKKAKAKKPKK